MDYLNTYYNDEFEKYVNKFNKKEIKEKRILTKVYNFNGLKNLNKNFNDINYSEYKNIYICGYKINTKIIKPFIEYLLIETNNLLFLPFIDNDDREKISINLNDVILKLIFEKKVEVKKLLKGYKDYENDMYIFVDLTEEIYNIKNKNNFFVIVDELINYKNSFNYEINNNICNFFINNIDMCLLYDIKNNLIETPIVGYVLKYNNEIEFTYNIGLIKEVKGSILGPYYYFNDYDYCIENIKENTLKYNKYGIIRFVIFLGKMKVILNYEEEEINHSEYKRELLIRENTNINRLMNRITDYEGVWTNNYDSVFIGEIVLDDGTNYKKNALWVIKEKNSFIALSCKYM